MSGEGEDIFFLSSASEVAVEDSFNSHHRVLSYWTASGADGASCSISTQGGASSSGKVILSALYQTNKSTKKAQSINAPVVPVNKF